MSIRFDPAKRLGGFVASWRTRMRLRRELEQTSDRALAELSLARGDVADVVAGTYRRAA